MKHILAVLKHRGYFNEIMKCLNEVPDTPWYFNTEDEHASDQINMPKYQSVSTFIHNQNRRDQTILTFLRHDDVEFYDYIYDIFEQYSHRVDKRKMEILLNDIVRHAINNNIMSILDWVQQINSRDFDGTLLTDSFGKSAYDLSIQLKNIEILDWLYKNGVSSMNYSGYIRVFEMNNISVFQTVIRHHPLSKSDLLKKSIELAKPELLNYILNSEYGYINLNTDDIRGEDLLESAVPRNDIEILKLVMNYIKIYNLTKTIPKDLAQIWIKTYDSIPQNNKEINKTISRPSWIVNRSTNRMKYVGLVKSYNYVNIVGKFIKKETIDWLCDTYPYIFSK